MLLSTANPESIEQLLNLTWFDDDVYKLLVRVVINFVFLTVIIRMLYYPIAKRKDYLFTYFLIGTITFFLCFGLKKLDIDTGMGLGLFAIFGIIRYRTDAIQIKEMTYLFLVIGVSVVNSLASNKISITEMMLINLTVVALTYGLERVWLIRHETRKTIVYEKIELIVPERHQEMMNDLQQRTGLNISRFEIGKINFLDDTAQVRIYFFTDSQNFTEFSS